MRFIQMFGMEFTRSRSYDIDKHPGCFFSFLFFFLTGTLSLLLLLLPRCSLHKLNCDDRGESRNVPCRRENINREKKIKLKKDTRHERISH